jgi:hypothetical protein
MKQPPGNNRDSHRSRTSDSKWVVPYIDQPLSFWMAISDKYPGLIKEVYFSMPEGALGSGRPPQPESRLREFLRDAPLAHSVLVNPLVLPAPVEAVAPPLIESLKRLHGEYGLAGATIANLELGIRIREAIPNLPLTASCLMQISLPLQVTALEDVIDTIVPDSRIVRDLPALTSLRRAFPGRIRLIVNESCLPGCTFRVQHFYEMGSGFPYPRSLCSEILAKHPWMRLTTGWVLPQHLHLYDAVCDEYKIAGRVTLREPQDFLRVLDAYACRSPLTPGDIGGGPASVLERMEISEEFFAQTLACGHDCHHCSLCRDYYEAALGKRATT